jgi:hypothetical protein
MSLKMIRKYAHRYINLKIGLIGALIMGSIVFIINMEHGWFLSTTAAMKQGLYTFFFGGIIVKLLEYLLRKITNPYLSIPVSVLVISGFTSLLVYGIHSLKGTPEPLLSTIPTLLMAPPGFLFLALRFKKKG